MDRATIHARMGLTKQGPMGSDAAGMRAGWDGECDAEWVGAAFQRFFLRFRDRERVG